MPDGVGENTLVKVEHEEVVTFARFLKQYGLKKATFKISLDDNLITALKVIDHLGLRSLKPVQVGNVKVVPRDVVAACAPQPKDIGTEMIGEMLVGVHCIGEKDGARKSISCIRILIIRHQWHVGFSGSSGSDRIWRSTGN